MNLREDFINVITMNFSLHKFCLNSTGKSLLEALILASVNPLYDERLFIEFQEKDKLTKQKQNKNFVHNMLSTCIFLGIQ